MDGDSYRNELANIRLDMQKVLYIFWFNDKSRSLDLFRVFKLVREMVFAVWNALLPPFEPCAFGRGSMKMWKPSWLARLFGSCSKRPFPVMLLNSSCSFSEQKMLLRYVQSSPISCVRRCCAQFFQYSFFPPTPWGMVQHRASCNQSHGWWLHMSRAALPGPSSLACRIRHAETIVKHQWEDSSRVDY